ncbi:MULTISPECIES: endonuclease/exonuclease/phosphatase family protein [unclassified Carboxylicivirga]|uniref:endonuclease/exonuclease/phosphatase family protein n=1 Tax=Carboxylicivirga TaxID=1628153 RepID=UPI003D34FE68
MLIVRRLFSFVAVVLILSACSSGSGGIKKGEEVVIGFYNLENLFDTIDAPDVRDEEFTPDGRKAWTQARYKAKLQHMAQVISSLSDTVGQEYPAIVGLCEVENRTVVEDLVKEKSLAGGDYQIVHQDSPDRRGIDVALIYRSDLFNPETIKAIPLMIYDAEDSSRIYTRDQLLVSGLLGNEKIHLLVNHWPSRYGGEERSRPLRKEAALLSRSIVDSLLALDEGAKVLVMGDLNDDPHNVSVKDVLRGRTRSELTGDDVYNPFARKHQAGEGTLCYRGKWNLFDQIILTQGLLGSEQGLRYEDALVYSYAHLKVPEGKYKGYPFRTYVGNRHDGGYSDHFPVSVVLKMY